MTTQIGNFNNEIIQIAESVAREKGIARHSVLAAMEQAIAVASRKKFGFDNDIKVTINQVTGETKISRMRVVVEHVENYHKEISLEEARYKNFEANIGDIIAEPLPPIDIARVAAQSAKQVILQKIREAEREKQYEEYKDKVGEIINGTVKRVEFGDVVVDLGRGEGVITKDKLIRGEIYKINDRVRAYIQEVKKDSKGPQIILSRTSNEFLSKLFELEVPEVYDKNIEIKAVAREPGSKAKVAVFSSDSSIDAVGSCVGVRGARVQAITNELKGEKIDVILWTRDLAKYAISALSPTEISKVILDEDNKKIEVVVPQEQLSIAIGRKGQNVRLASSLIGWNIDILTDDEESKRRNEEFNSTTNLFMSELGLEEVLAQLLAAEGFSSIEDLAYVDPSELSSIEGIDEELAAAIITRASANVEKSNEVYAQELKRLGCEDELISFTNLDLKTMLNLANQGVKSVEDLAEITVDEFRQMLPKDLQVSQEELQNLIDRAKESSAS